MLIYCFPRLHVTDGNHKYCDVPVALVIYIDGNGHWSLNCSESILLSCACLTVTKTRCVHSAMSSQGVGMLFRVRGKNYK